MFKLYTNRFVAVLGASGSGKSSLMFCGLIPSLYGGFIAGAGSNWRIAVARPGNNPITNLSKALLKGDFLYQNSSPEEQRLRENITTTILRSTSLGLVEAVRQTTHLTNESIFILIDQFEELFRFRRTEENGLNDSIHFVRLLVEASQQRDLPIFISLTMRSDFVGIVRNTHSSQS